MSAPPRVTLLLLAVLLSGCTTQEGPVAAPSFDVPDPDQVLVLADYRYEPSDLRIPAGQEGYLLYIDNQGEDHHDFTVEGLPEDVRVHLAMATGHGGLYPLPALPAGEYVMYCSLPGHRDAGMEGTLTVT